MWGDLDIHVKFRILKCGKYTNFILAMNVVLLTLILGSVSEVVCGEMSETVRVCERELSSWESERERESAFKGIEYIYRYLCHVTGSKWKILVGCRINSKHVDMVEHTSMWLLCLIRFPKLSNQPTAHYFCFKNKWVLDPIFLEFFCSMCSLLAI